jgi:hypothetical protein
VSLITRRSLLRTAVLTPLVLPRPSIARGFRGGGLLSGTGPSGSCGAPTTIGVYTDIHGPGCYSLINDDPSPVMQLRFYNDVTLLGNGFSCQQLLVGRNDFSLSGIVIKDLKCRSINAYGNLSTTQTAPAITLDNVTRLASSVEVPVLVYGSNILIKNSTFYGDEANPANPGCDDPFVLYNADSTHRINYYVTFDNCSFGTNYDVGLEGVGNWDHVTVTNCRPVPGTRSGSVGSIGAWYGPDFPADHSYPFVLTNCIFTGNTVQGFEFAIPGGFSRFNAQSDALANATWGTGGSAGTVGNIFGAPAGPANIYNP